MCGPAPRFQVRCRCQTAAESWGSAWACWAAGRRTPAAAAGWPATMRRRSSGRCCSRLEEMERRWAPWENGYCRWLLRETKAEITVLKRGRVKWRIIFLVNRISMETVVPKQHSVLASLKITWNSVCADDSMSTNQGNNTGQLGGDLTPDLKWFTFPWKHSQSSTFVSNQGGSFDLLRYPLIKNIFCIWRLAASLLLLLHFSPSLQSKQAGTVWPPVLPEHASSMCVCVCVCWGSWCTKRYKAA